MYILDPIKFKEISITTCINCPIDSELNSYIKRKVNEIIEKGKKSHSFNKMGDDTKIEYILKYSLLEIVPSKQWQDFNRDKEDDILTLYTSIKRNYFLKTGHFPE